jgi:hypothetical protein
MRIADRKTEEKNIKLTGRATSLHEQPVSAEKQSRRPGAGVTPVTPESAGIGPRVPEESAVRMGTSAT